MASQLPDKVTIHFLNSDDPICQYIYTSSGLKGVLGYGVAYMRGLTVLDIQVGGWKQAQYKS